MENPKFVTKHFVVEATSEEEIKKLESFSAVFIDVASDMGLNAYEDDNHRLIGTDY